MHMQRSILSSEQYMYRQILVIPKEVIFLVRLVHDVHSIFQIQPTERLHFPVMTFTGLNVKKTEGTGTHL